MWRPIDTLLVVDTVQLGPAARLLIIRECCLLEVVS